MIHSQEKFGVYTSKIVVNEVKSESRFAEKLKCCILRFSAPPSSTIGSELVIRIKRQKSYDAV